MALLPRSGVWLAVALLCPAPADAVHVPAVLQLEETPAGTMPASASEVGGERGQLEHRGSAGLRLPQAAAGPAAELTGADWPAPQAARGVWPPLPRGAGCYVWLPTGCRRQRFQATTSWRRDVWGEANMGAAANRAACEARKFAFDTWCGVDDAVMSRVSADSQDGGRGSGASARAAEQEDAMIAAGMANEAEETLPDEDIFPDENAEAAWIAPDAAPEEAGSARKERRAAPVWRSEFQGESGEPLPGGLPEGAPQFPRGAGCYVWLPSGCRKKHFAAKEHWKRDDWGEANIHTEASADACKRRKHDFDNWCGVQDAVMLPLPRGAARAAAR